MAPNAPFSQHAQKDGAEIGSRVLGVFATNPLIPWLTRPIPRPSGADSGQWTVDLLRRFFGGPAYMEDVTKQRRPAPPAGAHREMTADPIEDTEL